MILTSGPERVDLWLPTANITKEWQDENSELGESVGEWSRKETVAAQQDVQA